VNGNGIDRDGGDGDGVEGGMTKWYFGLQKPKGLGEKRIERLMDFFFFLGSTQVFFLHNFNII
jgi:hypothetical protein